MVYSPQLDRTVVHDKRRAPSRGPVGREVAPRTQSGRFRQADVFVERGGTETYGLPNIAPRTASGLRVVCAASLPPAELLTELDLAGAIASPEVVPLDPAALPDIPAALLDAIDGARTVLLIGHIRPDADCVGSTVSLARALRLMGKRVDVCVDDDLSAQLRRVDDQNQVRRASKLTDKRWDLALVMDTNAPDRIGGALALLGGADTVGIVDHHEGTPTREGFGVAPQRGFIDWVNASYPAAAMMSAGIIGRLGNRISARQHRSVYEPALAGFATDVGFGKHPGQDKTHFGYFKFMAARAGVSVDELRDRITVPPPANVTKLVAGEPVDLPPDLAARLEALKASGEAVSFSRHGALSTLACPAAYFDFVLDVARREEPAFNRPDLTMAFKDRRDALLEEHRGVAAVLFGHGDTTTISLRGVEGDHAHRMAVHFGGGGHKRAAAARARGQSITQVADELVRLMASE